MINVKAVVRQLIYKKNRRSMFMSHIKRDLSNNTLAKVKDQ